MKSTTREQPSQRLSERKRPRGEWSHNAASRLSVLQMDVSAPDQIDSWIGPSRIVVGVVGPQLGRSSSDIGVVELLRGDSSSAVSAAIGGPQGRRRCAPDSRPATLSSSCSGYAGEGVSCT